MDERQAKVGARGVLVDARVSRRTSSPASWVARHPGCPRWSEGTFRSTGRASWPRSLRSSASRSWRSPGSRTGTRRRARLRARRRPGAPAGAAARLAADTGRRPDRRRVARRPVARSSRRVSGAGRPRSSPRSVTCFRTSSRISSSHRARRTAWSVTRSTSHPARVPHRPGDIEPARPPRPGLARRPVAARCGSAWWFAALLAAAAWDLCGVWLHAGAIADARAVATSAIDASTRRPAVTTRRCSRSTARCICARPWHTAGSGRPRTLARTWRRSREVAPG